MPKCSLKQCGMRKDENQPYLSLHKLPRNGLRKFLFAHFILRNPVSIGLIILQDYEMMLFLSTFYCGPCSSLVNRKIFSTASLIHRSLQVSIIGSSNVVGSNLGLLLKQNELIDTLHLHDDDTKLDGVALELGLIPEGPKVVSYCGEKDLGEAIKDADLILMVPKVHRIEPRNSYEELTKNAPEVINLCTAMAQFNPTAFLAIAEEPVNSLVPLAAACLRKYNVYNPKKLCGVAQIDNVRSRAIAARFLKVRSSLIDVPVIGGHSNDTMVPLFSNISLKDFKLEPDQLEWLSRVVRKIGLEVNPRQAYTQETLTKSWSLHEFVEGMAIAMRGGRVVLSCFVANSHFGPHFFAGPTVMNIEGIAEVFQPLQISYYEQKLLDSSISLLAQDIADGERIMADSILPNKT